MQLRSRTCNRLWFSAPFRGPQQHDADSNGASARFSCVIRAETGIQGDGSEIAIGPSFFVAIALIFASGE